MDFAFRQLRTKELGEAAVSSVRRLLGADQGSFHSPSEAQRAKLKEYGLPLLKEALDSPEVAEAHKTELRNCFLHLIEEQPPQVDLKKFRKLLLNRKDEGYHGMGGGELEKLLVQAKRASDPRLVPVLIEALAKVPETRGSQASGFHATLERYAVICRNAMREEIERREMTREAFGTTWEASHFTGTRLPALLEMHWTH